MVNNEVMEEDILGIDEAGRGPLAGPLVVAGVYLSSIHHTAIRQASIPIRDSKTLSEKQREDVFGYIESSRIIYRTFCIDVPQIDDKGIGRANTEAIKQVINNVPIPDRNILQVVVDGYFPPEKIAVEGVSITTQVDADATVLPVILAGIVAKVTRDRIMKQIHEEFPVYNWTRNKGYGTKEHIQAIIDNGSSPYHRTMFVETALKHVTS